MTGVTFDGFDGVDRVAATLTKSAATSGPLARAVVRKVAYDVQADAQAFAPVDTGNLRSSISTTLAGNASYAEAEVGPTADYGAHVEYGTSRQAPQAYMGPAFDRHAGTFVTAMEQLAARALDE